MPEGCLVHFQHAIGKASYLDGIPQHAPDDLLLLGAQDPIHGLLIKQRSSTGLNDVDRILKIVNKM